MTLATSLSHASILFCDIVGFSKYLDHVQPGVITSLNAEVAKELFPLLGMQGTMPKAICVPTGDGLLIVMLEHSEPRILFSLIMSLRAWSDTVTQISELDPPCRLRIGVHFGRVSIIPDVNRLVNACGDDINTCRRIMDQARPNQVLFSADAHDKYMGRKKQSGTVGATAYAASPFSREQPTECGPPTTITVKHNVQLKVHVMTQRGTSKWSPEPPMSPPRVIEGAEAVKERTKVINDKFRDLLRRNRRGIRIYEQATFSSFDIERMAEDMQRLDSETIEELQEQKRLLEELLRKKRAKMKVLLRAIPSEPSQFREVNIRYKTLGAWMDTNLSAAVGGAKASAPCL